VYEIYLRKAPKMPVLDWLRHARLPL